MAFKVKQVKELYLLDTKLENIFINEFMTAAPGDFVKVYLLSLMYAGSGIETDNAGIAKQLSVEEEDVLKAWNYWEGLGAIKKHYKNSRDKFSYDVEFLCIKEQLYGKKTKQNPGDGASELPQLLNDTELKTLYHTVERLTGRLLSGKEITEIASWMNDFGANTEMIACAYSYCVKKKKDNCKYVGTVVKGWVSERLFTASDIEAHLQDVDKRHYLHKRVLKAMGFTRNATEEEKRLMDTWFDEMECSIDKVLEACSKTSGISSPNFNYVNRILVNWHAEKTAGKKPEDGSGKKVISIADVNRYYDMIRKQAEDSAGERRAQVFAKVPEIKRLDDELRACGMEMSRIMISGGADRQTRVARYKDKAKSLSGQKAALLAENGYEADYMEVKYRCAVCRDTGIDDNGERCVCFKDIQNEAELWQISSKN